MVPDSVATDWLRATSLGFAPFSPADEFMHPDPGSPDPTTTETWWFEAIEPREGLIASFYISVRRNLGICAAGAWMWRGHRENQVLADHLNFKLFLPQPTVAGSLLSASEVGLSFEFIEPMRLTRIRYLPPALDCVADLTARALMPPAMRGNGKHFEQAIWIEGTIRIGENTYTINGPSFRDRSWGEPRPENAITHPPIGWLCGVVDQGRTAFNLSGCDDPAAGPVWAGSYDIDSTSAFFDGWIMQAGELRRVVRMSKRTQRIAAERQRPDRIEVDFVDDHGDSHHLDGCLRTSYWMHHWPNTVACFGLADWTLDGCSGYGEAQDYAWPDYAKKFW